MAEPEVGLNDGRKRRLPSWMYGASTDVENGTTYVLNVDEQSIQMVSAGPKKVKDKDSLLNEENALEFKPKKVGRKKNIADEGTKISLKIPKRCALQINESRIRNVGKRRRRKNILSESEEADGVGCGQEADNVASMDASDDETVLTVEDLIRIAREYVNADAEKKIKEQTIAAPSTVVNDLKTNVSQPKSLISIKKSLGISPGPEATLSGPLEKTLASCSSTISMVRKGEPREPESSTLNTTVTGDVAQDMLNLFLGPWLQKPDTKEMKLDNAYVLEPIKQSANRSAENLEAPAEKKKSSLKDKVSLFLY